MHLIDGVGATADQQFTEGNPISGVQATVVTASWLNAVQNELANAIRAAGLALDRQNSGQLAEAIVRLASGGTPVGAMLEWPMSTAPDGFLICDGHPLIPGEHDTLRAMLIADGYRWGVDVNGNPRIPDRRGVFGRGVDGGRGIDPGRELGSFQKGSLVVGNSSTESIKGVVMSGAHVDAGFDVADLEEYPAATMAYTNPLAVNIKTGPVNDDESGITRPANIALHYIIKT